MKIVVRAVEKRKSKIGFPCIDVIKVIMRLDWGSVRHIIYVG